MNKVVCYVCGTSYPENASQCPICGYSRTADGIAPSSSGNSTYTHVKGGRYSKANVKKRNQGSQSIAEQPVKEKKVSEQKKSRAGMIVVIIILSIAIIAAAAYIALRFFIPNDFIFEGLDNLKLPASAQTQESDPIATLTDSENEPATEAFVETEDAVIPGSCTAVTLSHSEIELETVGSTIELVLTLEPADTQDEISFVSSDESVVTVNEYGVVTMVGEGSAIITVSCGTASAECKVVCTVPVTEPEKEVFTLNRKEITFDAEGQSWLLYDGEIPAEDIVWTSDDNSIVTIDNGKVIAVSEGNTTVHGIYDDQTASCIIHCNFSEDSSASGNISEAGADAKRTYTLHNPTGYADDVTLKVDEQFTLLLVDENKKEISDAQWSVKNDKVCSYKDDIVKALKVGTTEITATYEGTTYTCVVRVIE